jgi:hypothetical protein
MSKLLFAALIVIAIVIAVIAVLVVSHIGRKVVPPGKTLTALDFISDNPGRRHRRSKRR